MEVGRQLRPRGLGKSHDQKVKEMQLILSELGYGSMVMSSTLRELSMVSARKNGVCHKLAARHPEVCQFDFALMEELLEDHPVSQTDCMMRGGTSCPLYFQAASA